MRSAYTSNTRPHRTSGLTRNHTCNNLTIQVTAGWNALLHGRQRILARCARTHTQEDTSIISLAVAARFTVLECK